MQLTQALKLFFVVVASVLLTGAYVANADCPALCTPKIDRKHTVIQPVPGLRGDAGIVPAYGNCPQGTGTFHWLVLWDSQVQMSGNLTSLKPFNAEYSYHQAGVYNVTVGYCAYHESPCCRSCDYLTRTIHVKN